MGAHAGVVRLNLDTPTHHHHGGSPHGGVISSEPALQHVTAPVEHHGDLHHLRKHHKVHMLNEHNHLLNHKTEPKAEEEKAEGKAEKEEPKEEKKNDQKQKAKEDSKKRKADDE